MDELEKQEAELKRRAEERRLMREVEKLKAKEEVLEKIDDLQSKAELQKLELQATKLASKSQREMRQMQMIGDLEEQRESIKERQRLDEFKRIAGAARGTSGAIMPRSFRSNTAFVLVIGLVVLATMFAVVLGIAGMAIQINNEDGTPCGGSRVIMVLLFVVSGVLLCAIFLVFGAAGNDRRLVSSCFGWGGSIGEDDSSTFDPLLDNPPGCCESSTFIASVCLFVTLLYFIASLTAIVYGVNYGWLQLLHGADALCQRRVRMSGTLYAISASCFGLAGLLVFLARGIRESKLAQ